MIGVALIALAFIILLVLAHYERRRFDRPARGSRPEVVLNERHPRRNGSLPYREDDWRNDPSVHWADPRFIGGSRRRP
jgi:hypothetical protein